MELLTTAEAAARCRLSPRTLEKYRLTPGQGPPFVRKGNAVRYRPDDLDAWIEALPRHHSTAEYRKEETS